MAFGFGFGMPRSFAVARFSPLSLFASGAPGVWYDPSDYGATGTLFQDSAGTTPVTAVEQPVGLMLDKSQGLVLGSELVTNGGGSSLTGWTSVGAAIFTVDANRFKGTVTGIPSTSGGIRQDITVVAGKSYKVSIDIDLTVVGTGRAQLIVYDGAAFTPEILSVQKTVASSYVISGYVRPTGTTIRVYLVVAADSLTTTTAYFDNISVRELPGNHAFQSTSASRPVLSARYNLLTKTEDFSAAVWNAANITFPSTTQTSPIGTNTATQIKETATTGFHNVSQTISITGTSSLLFWAKADGRNRVILREGVNTGATVVYDLSTGTVAGIGGTAFTSPTMTAAGGGYYCTATFTGSFGSFQLFTARDTDTGIASYAGDVTKGIIVWGASLVPANQSTLPYQRVSTATDYNTVGFLPYLKFDGVDDSLSTNSINFTSTDKMSVFAGVRMLQSSSFAVLSELSSDVFSNNGAFALLAPRAAAAYGYRSRGTANADTTSAGFYVAPITNVLTGLGDISGDLATLRVNGTQAAQSTADQGTGNFGNYPLYIGRRGGSSLPFNGQLYSMIIVGKAVTATELSSTETYTASKTGVTLA